MAAMNQLGGGLSDETHKHASDSKKFNEEYVSSLQRRAAQQDKRNEGQTLRESSVGNEDEPDEADLWEMSKKVRAVDRFLADHEDIPSELEDEPPLVFSDEYEARKTQMLQAAFDRNESDSRTETKRRFRIPAAAAAAIAVIAITASLTQVSADAMPEPVRILMMQIQDIFSGSEVEEIIEYAPNQVTDFPTEILTAYEPTLVLEGYEIRDIVSQNKYRTVCYTTEDRIEYIFRQKTIDYWNGLNTEDIDYIEVLVDGQYPGITYIQSDQCVIQWQRDKYVFEVSGKVERSELEQVAASVEPVEELDAQ